MCQQYQCPGGMTRCPHDDQCIHDQELCDGQSQCPGGEDELSMRTSDGVTMHCNVSGSRCRLYHGRGPAPDHSTGVTCAGDQVQCVRRHVWCDGTCDCAACQDETSCDTWSCDQFKCEVSGKCLDNDYVCDGFHDCGEDDRSDEHDCSCDTDQQKNHFRSLKKLIVKVGENCLKQSNPFSVRIQSIKIDNIRFASFTIKDLENIQFYLFSKTVQVNVDKKTEVNSNCSFSSSEQKHLDRWNNFFYITTFLPLTETGYIYYFARESNKEVHGKHLRTNHYWFLRQKFKSYKLFFLRGLNDLSDIDLPVDDNEIRGYVKDVLRKNLGQNIVAGSFSISQDKTLSLQMNEFFPTVVYDKVSITQNSSLREDKNLSINVTIFKIKRNCKRKVVNLILLMKYASSGRMKTKEGDHWRTYHDDQELEQLLCQPSTFLHTFPDHSNQVMNLVLMNSSQCRDEHENIQFLVANQRENLYRKHKLRSLNVTFQVKVQFHCVAHSREEIKNKNLMNWLYIQNNKNENQSFLHSQLVRKEKYYFQTQGNVSLNSLLQVYNDSSFSDQHLHRICVDPELECSNQPIRDLDKVVKTLQASWIPRDHCVNVEIDENIFTIVASVADHYFTPQHHQHDVKSSAVINPDSTSSPELVTVQLLGHQDQSRQKRSKRSQSRTYLFHYSNLNTTSSLTDKIHSSPQFYLSTLLSASLSNNSDCVRSLQSEELSLVKRGCYSGLGPSDNLWSSPCFSDLSLALVETLFQASQSGVAYLNRFWPFELYNFVIFSLEPDCGLSDVSYYSTLILSAVLLLVGLVTILGNLATIFTLSSDTKKTCYYYLQICLCVADMILAASGTLVSAVTNIMFLTNHLQPSDFLSEDMFHQFQYSEDAVKIGFNSVVKTDLPWLVTSAAAVTLSSTVSIISISLMAVVR